MPARKAFPATHSCNAGAYRLHIRLSRPAWISAGALGRVRLDSGHYVYVGSARRNLTQRVARHRSVAAGQRRGGHWHIDGLLSHRYARLFDAELLMDADECRISHALAAQSGVEVPVAGFGATDCRAGCPAHLYRIMSGAI